jgi:hypothetical protein
VPKNIMNRETLIRQLRQRLGQKYHRGDIAARTDEQILSAYLRCATCGLSFFDANSLGTTDVFQHEGVLEVEALVVSKALDVDKFLFVVTKAMKDHRCPAAN